MAALDAIEDWPVSTVAAAVVGPSGVLAQHGDLRHRFELASVTKPLVARAAQVAVEEGVVELDTEAGPPGSTVRHLLAHASGYSMHSADLMAEPGKRRVYSNYGFGVLAGHDPAASGIEFGRYLTEAMFEPLGMTDTTLQGGAEAAGFGADVDRRRPGRVRRRPAATVDGLATDALRGHRRAVSGPVRGVARIRDAATQRLGPGLRDQGRQVAALDGFGQLGRAPTGISASQGRFCGLIPEADLALVALTDRDFGDWAYSRWPALSDGVLREFERRLAQQVPHRAQ